MPDSENMRTAMIGAYIDVHMYICICVLQYVSIHVGICLEIHFMLHTFICRYLYTHNQPVYLHIFLHIPHVCCVYIYIGAGALFRKLAHTHEFVEANLR
jgi:hypothetical protein